MALGLFSFTPLPLFSALALPIDSHQSSPPPSHQSHHHSSFPPLSSLPFFRCWLCSLGFASFPPLCVCVYAFSVTCFVSLPVSDQDRRTFILGLLWLFVLYIGIPRPSLVVLSYTSVDQPPHVFFFTPFPPHKSLFSRTLALGLAPLRFVSSGLLQDRRTFYFWPSRPGLRTRHVNRNIGH